MRQGYKAVIDSTLEGTGAFKEINILLERLNKDISAYNEGAPK